MIIEVNECGGLILKKVFSGITLETEEGNQVHLCMRDDTVEIYVIPKNSESCSQWRVNMNNCNMERLL